MIQWKWLNDEKLYKVYKNGNIYFMPVEMNSIHSTELYTNKIFVFIIENGKCGRRYVDELVYTTFIGKIKKTCKLIHIDKNENNVNLENLKLVYINNVDFEIPEGWKLVDGYCNKYVANMDGNIKKLGQEKSLTYETRKLHSGTYNYVYFVTPEKRYFERVDKIIHETFRQKLQNDTSYIRHKNGNNLDDSLLNLQVYIPLITSDFNIKNFPEWIPVIGYETRYECNGLGQLRNKSTGVIIKGSNCNVDGMYVRVKISDDNFVKKEYNLHRIVYESFAKKKIDQSVVIDHIDKNKLNNNISNLRATTQSENMTNRIHKKHNTEKIDVLDEKFINVGKKLDGYDFSDYECNKFGQIRSILKNNILHGHVDKGYHLHGLQDKLTKKRITMRVHRIVAATYLPNPNPDKFDVVHHKNGDRTNNHLDNLEWTTQQQNTIYSVGRKVGRYDMQGNLLKVYNSISLIDDVSTNCHVAEVCSGKRKTCAGYKWKYMD